MKAKKTSNYKKPMIVGGTALVLLLGSFYIASADVLGDASSFIASVSTALSGRPAVIIARNSASPVGSIKMGVNSVLAIYDVSAKNVSNWATLSSTTLNIDVSSRLNSQLNFSSLSAQYSYCIPTNSHYGYGRVSKGCSTVYVTPTSYTKTSSGYTVAFDSIRIYPQATRSTLTIMAVPNYAYTGISKKAVGQDASIQTNITGGYASGDACTRWYGYGYSGCVAQSAILNLASPRGFALKVQRIYGYGYLAR